MMASQRYGALAISCNGRHETRPFQASNGHVGEKPTPFYQGRLRSAFIASRLEGRCSIHLSYGRVLVINISAEMIYEFLSLLSGAKAGGLLGALAPRLHHVSSTAARTVA